MEAKAIVGLSGFVATYFIVVSAGVSAAVVMIVVFRGALLGNPPLVLSLIASVCAAVVAMPRLAPSRHGIRNRSSLAWILGEIAAASIVSFAVVLHPFFMERLVVPALIGLVCAVGLLTLPTAVLLRGEVGAVRSRVRANVCLSWFAALSIAAVVVGCGNDTYYMYLGYLIPPAVFGLALALAMLLGASLAGDWQAKGTGGGTAG